MSVSAHAQTAAGTGRARARASAVDQPAQRLLEPRRPDRRRAGLGAGHPALPDRRARSSSTCSSGASSTSASTLLTTHPQPGLDQSEAGGFLDPIMGTFVLTDPRHRRSPRRSAWRSRSG